VLGRVKAKPSAAAKTRPALTRPARAGVSILRSGRGKACGAVEQGKWTGERKWCSIDKFALAFTLAIRERKDDLGRTKRWEEKKEKQLD
jgi:hypothetical protein